MERGTMSSARGTCDEGRQVIPEPTLIVTDAPDAEAHAAIAGGLNAFNDDATGIADRRPLAVLVKDKGGVIGGVLGRTSLGLLFIDLVFLPENLRGGGIGRRMIVAAEDEGRRRGCVA